MRNVTHCFVGNLTDFWAVKEFGKSVKIWWNYRHKRVAHFSETQCRIISSGLSLSIVYLILPCVPGWRESGEESDITIRTRTSVHSVSWMLILSLCYEFHIFVYRA